MAIEKINSHEKLAKFIIKIKKTKQKDVIHQNCTSMKFIWGYYRKKKVTSMISKLWMRKTGFQVCTSMWKLVRYQQKIFSNFIVNVDM